MIARCNNTTPNRQCKRCYEFKPETPQFFEFRKSTVPSQLGAYRGTCRACRRERDNKEKKGLERLRNSPRMRVCRPRGALKEVYVQGPKPCRVCGSLPWRVDSLSCHACGLAYSAEPRPELQLRKFDRVG